MPLQRDHENKMILGVCAGLAKEMNIDPTVMRLIFAVATLMGFGLPILIYIILAIVMK